MIECASSIGDDGAREKENEESKEVGWDILHWPTMVIPFSWKEISECTVRRV